MCHCDGQDLIISNGNRTKWSPIRSVIIQVINKIGRPRSGSPICLITSMITDLIIIIIITLTIIIIIIIIIISLLGARGRGFPPANMNVAPSYFHRKVEEK